MRIEETIINIIFDAAKGDVALSSKEGVVGKAFGELPVPTRPGFAFDGWYLGDELVTTSTVISSKEDIRLVAHWVKKAGSKKVTMYKKQRLAVVALSILTVVLIATLVLVKYFTAIYGLEDIYFGDDGTQYTEKYYVKKADGVYALFDKEGNRMEVNADGYHVAKSGNLYIIDAETGEYALYAMVDYDSVGGETLGYSDRIMMYPQIKQSDTNFIEVTNEHGTYKFYRDPKDGYVKIAGSEDAVVNYDAELYAGLCVSTGYMLTMQKIDMTSPYVPLNPDGSIDYSAYGLGADAARFTINGTHLKDINNDGVIRADEYVTAEYTVLVGDAILSDGGYYVQFEKGVLTADGYYYEMDKRAAVYIVSADIQDTVLQPVEALVTPMVVYPTTMTQYLMVYDFVLGTANLKESAADPTKNMEPIVAFSFADLDSRLNTVYSTRPYIPVAFEDDDFWSRLSLGYNINDNNASFVLGNMYEMQFLGCKKLGIYKLDENGDPVLNSENQKMLDSDVLAKFGLDEDIFYMEYASPLIDSNGDNVYDDQGNQQYVLNQLLISQKTEQGTYYVASLLCDMIVEVDQYYLSFLEWNRSNWYDEYFFSYSLAYLQGLELIYGDRAYTFSFDNTLSYAFYEKSAGKWSVIDLEKGRVEQSANGDYTYYDKDGTRYDDIRVVDFSRKDAFSVSSQRVYYTDTDGTKLEITLSSPNLYAYCQQYTQGKVETDRFDNADKIWHEYTSDSGEPKVESVSTIDNFRIFYQMLLWFTIEGDVDPAEFQSKMGMTMEEYIAKGDSACQAIIKAQVKDYASVLNQETDNKGNKVWTEDNEMDLVIRFYKYSEWKSLLTIEVIEKYDSDGNPISDPTKVACSFYVDAVYVEKIAAAAEQLINRELLESN